MGKKDRRQRPVSRPPKQTSRFVTHFFQGLQTAFRRQYTLRNAALLILILTGFLIRLKFIGQTIKYDESFTFLRFATLPFAKLIGYYPLPNNHILHTVLVRASVLLFGPWEWVIRLPVFIAGILLLPVMYRLGNKAVKPGAGFWAASLAAVSSGLAAYSVNARGYILVCLFTALVFMAALNIRESGGTWKDWLTFILGSVAGLFTVPVMLFPVASLSVWLLWDVNPEIKGARLSILRRLALAGVGIVSGTAFCYTPLILDSGLKALIANKYVSPQPVSDVITRLPEYAKEVLGYFVEVLPLPMQAILLVAFLLGLRRIPRLALSVALCTLALLLYQRVIPPVRALTFGLVFFLVFGAAGLHSISEWLAVKLRLSSRIPLSMSLAIIWAVSGAFFFARLPFLGQAEENYPEAPKVSAFIAPYLNDDTDLFGMTPECDIIAYYLSDRGGKSVNIGSEEGAVKAKLLMVANLRHGSVDSIMQTYPYRFVPYNYPQKLTQIDSTVVCLLGSIDAEGLKPGSMLEKYVSDFWRKDRNSTHDPKNIGPVLNMLFRLHRVGTMDSMLARMLVLDPHNTYALEKFGDLKRMTGQLDAAEKYYRQLIELDPQNKTGLSCLGLIEGRRGNTEQAKQYFQHVLRQDSTDFTSLSNLALVYLKSGENQDAILWFTKALSQRPDDLNALLGLGTAFSASPGNREKALETFRKAQAFHPDRKEIIERSFVEPLFNGATLKATVQ